MRRLCLIVAVSLLAAPAAALGDRAARTAPGDGSLVVTGGNGKLLVQGRGLIYGHLDRGTIVVSDYKADDSTAPSVSGARLKVVGNAVVYSGTDVRFLFPGGKYTLELDGVGIDVSAVGKGTVVAVGQDGIDDGSFAVDGGRDQPLGALPVTVTFGHGPPPGAGAGGAAAAAGGGKGR